LRLAWDSRKLDFAEGDRNQPDARAAERFAHAPVPADLTVDNAHCIDGLEADFGACASDAKKIPSMRAVISLEGGDHIAVDALPMISGVKSGKASRKRL
jgi:hypothetical protein